MTQLLEKAFAEAQKLTSDEQDQLASIIIEEMLDDKKWDRAFGRSLDKLDRLADEALANYREGNVSPLGLKE